MGKRKSLLDIQRSLLTKRRTQATRSRSHVTITGNEDVQQEAMVGGDSDAPNLVATRNPPWKGRAVDVGTKRNMIDNEEVIPSVLYDKFYRDLDGSEEALILAKANHARRAPRNLPSWDFLLHGSYHMKDPIMRDIMKELYAGLNHMNILMNIEMDTPVDSTNSLFDCYLERDKVDDLSTSNLRFPGINEISPHSLMQKLFEAKKLNRRPKNLINLLKTFSIETLNMLMELSTENNFTTSQRGKKGFPVIPENIGYELAVSFKIMYKWEDIYDDEDTYPELCDVFTSLWRTWNNRVNRVRSQNQRAERGHHANDLITMYLSVNSIYLKNFVSSCIRIIEVN